MRVLDSKLGIVLGQDSLSGPGLQPPPYSRRNDFARTKAYLYRVVGGVPLNPTDQSKSSATKESFAQLESDEAHAAIPDRLALDKLWQDLVSPHPASRVVVVYGERGTGKTAAVNWLIDRHYQSELKTRRITWFRTDILRIYKHPTKVKLLSYTLAHSIYVALSHASSDSAFFGIDKPQDNTSSFFNHLVEASPADNYVMQLWRELLAVWKAVDRSADSINEARSGFEDEPRKQFIWTACELFEQARGARPGRLVVFSNEFYKFVMKQAPGGVWLVLDGIDNVDRLDGDERYEEVLAELRQLPSQTTTWFTKIILVMRGVTFEDYTRNSAVEFPSNPLRHLVEPKQPESLFLAKPKIAKNPRSPYFRLDYEGAILELRNSKRYIGSLEQFYPEFKIQLASLINRFPIYSINGAAEKRIRVSTEDSAWQLLFNRSLRSYSRNVVSSYIFLLRLFQNQGVLDGTGDVDDEIWLRSFIDGLRQRRRLIAEGSVLAGEDFICREHDRGTNPPGRWCPNLFWHNCDDECDYWGGLISIRVLQLLASKANGRAVTERRISEDLSRLFGYWPSHVAKSVRLLREFGLISADVRARAADSAPPEAGYRVRRKGLFICNLALSDPSVVYFLGEATPAPEEVQDRYFRHNVGPGSRNFHVATLRTGAAFLRLVRTTYDAEQKRAAAVLHGTPNSGTIELFRLFHVESGFSSWRKLVRSRVMALSRSSDPRSRVQAEEMIKWIDAETARLTSSAG